MLSLEHVESDLKQNFGNYWSMFYMSGETDATSYEWSRSQMIEVSEALFWVAFEKPKKLHSVDRFVVSEWLERIRAGREYYESKEDLLLLLSFGCHWTPSRICDALKISKSAFYFRLYHAIRLRSGVFRRSSGHLSASCAHYDLRFPEYILAKRSDEPMQLAVCQEMESHASTCTRCASLWAFSLELAELVGQTWHQSVPQTVLDEALQTFVDARNNPIKRNFWARIPSWMRTAVALAIVAGLAFCAFR